MRRRTKDLGASRGRPLRRTASLVVVLLGLSIVPGSPAVAGRSCMGRSATIVGSAGSDRLVGTRRVDVIVSLGDDDEIHGRGGADIICSGGGNDTVYAGGNDDRVKAGGGSDTVIAGSEANLLASGEDLLEGGPGDDILIGGPGADWMRGGDGVDALLGLTGSDHYDGGGGLDIAAFMVSQYAVVVDLAEGSATGEGEDSLTGIEAVVGSAYRDALIGDSEVNFLWGYGEDDLIDGGGGNDFALFGLSEVGIWADLSQGFAIGEGDDDLVSIENVVGSEHDDTLIGDASANYLSGEGGTDEVRGGGGDDGCIAESVQDCPPSLAAYTEGGELPARREAAMAPVPQTKDTSATKRRYSSGAGTLICPVGSSGGWANYPTYYYGLGRMATRLRWQNSSVWTDWSIHYWQSWDGYNRWYWNGANWILHNYFGEWVYAPPGAIVDVWWQPGDGAAWYQVGQCLVQQATPTGGIVGLGVFMVPR